MLPFCRASYIKKYYFSSILCTYYMYKIYKNTEIIRSSVSLWHSVSTKHSSIDKIIKTEGSFISWRNSVRRIVNFCSYMRGLEEWTSTWGTSTPAGYAKTSYINVNKTQEPSEPWISSDSRTHEDSSPNWGAGMPETSSIISLTGQNHINNW
jgi:hypothetical protein